MVGGGTKRPATEFPPPDASNPTAAPISVRFHLAALLFLAFLGIALLAIPLLFAVRTETGGFASALLAAIAIPMSIALFYSLRKGDLSWGAPRVREETAANGRNE